jgi:folylpolyglutamate synthase
MNLDAIPEMLEWTRKAGYEAEDFAKRGLRCIHVAGTKGKGSVCVMVENMLLQYRLEDLGGGGLVSWQRKGLGKIGLYTSPHLVTVRERIRIDGYPISESLFTRYFFELWDRFSSASKSTPLHPNTLSSETKPGYFRYLTLLAFHTFIKEKVETAIVECGIGGEYDSTNVLPPEAVTVAAITRLGIDHVGMLGDTIEKIAWHKAGIMKKGVPAFTVAQLPEAQTVLEERAAEKDAPLSVVQRLPALDNGKVKLGLDGDFQKDNASLAISVAASHLRTLGMAEHIPFPEDISTSHPQLPEKFVHGLQSVALQGRCEVRKHGNIEWYIDGAHTVDSIQATANWYHDKVRTAKEEPNPPTATMLIFNQQDRDPSPLIRTLLTNLQRGSDAPRFANLKEYERFKHVVFPNAMQQMFTYAAFCTNTAFKDEINEKELDLHAQEKMAKLYDLIDGNSLNVVYGSIEEAVELARRVAEGDARVLVLVTGSLHLVGGLLKVLEKQERGNAEAWDDGMTFDVRNRR